MKKLIFIAMLLIGASACAQDITVKKLIFKSGGNLYKVLLWTDSMEINGTKYYTFPGLGTTHTKAAYGDHGHSGVYEPVIGIGTTNQYWRGDKSWQSIPSGSQWSNNASNIYYNLGNVGIGTSTPSYKLSVSGGEGIAIFAYSQSYAAIEGQSDSYIGVYGTSSSGPGLYGVSSSGYGVYASSGSKTAGYFTTSSGLAGVFMGGNVGIGLTNPTYKLHVWGATESKIHSTGSRGLTVIGNNDHSFYAESTSSVYDAIYGANSSSGKGVEGYSNTGYGGYFTSASGNGLYASATSGHFPAILMGGNVGVNTTSPTAYLDVNSDVIRLRTSKTPSSSAATGNAGDICWDADYIYICTATNTWKRVAIATW